MKECHYDVLGLGKNATGEDIRRAWKKKALELHPDKHLDQQEEYRVKFQRAHQAYIVLSNPRERGHYDSNRDAILGQDEKEEIARWAASCVTVEQIRRYTSEFCYSGCDSRRRGFYTVYGKLFERIEMEEICAVRMDSETTFSDKYGSGYVFQRKTFGNENTAYTPLIEEFYAKFLNFSSVKSFQWYDKRYRGEGQFSRFERRYVLNEASKARNKHRSEYSDAVRSLAGFVMSRDPRHREYVEKINAKKAEEAGRLREIAPRRRRGAQAGGAEEAEEAEWTRADYAELDQELAELAIEEDEEELYCPACKRGYKSRKSFANHERSKKHLKMVKLMQESLFHDEEILSSAGQSRED